MLGLAGTERWLRATTLVALFACACDDSSGGPGEHGSGASGAGGEAAEVAGDAGGPGDDAATPEAVSYVGVSDSFTPFLLNEGGGGEGGAGVELPLGPPYGTSTSCGDAIVGDDEECDDGAGGADGCTAQCQTQDQPGGPPSATPADSSDRYLGAGRHPVSGLDSGFITTYVEAGGEEPAIGARLFNIWGQPTHDVTVSEGASPIYEANPVAAALPDGSYAVAWSDFDGDGSDLGVALRRVAQDGTLGSLRSANAGTEFSQLNPDMIWTGSQLVVAWEDYSDAESGPDLRVRTFDANLSPTSGELDLASSELPEAAVALAPFNGGWAAAFREGAADGSEFLVVRVGESSFRVGPVYGGPIDDRPALAELDETHLLLSFSAGTDPGASGLYNVPRLRYAVIDTQGSLPPSPQSLDPLDEVVTREAQTAQLSPALAWGSDGLYLAWRSEARAGDAAGDQLWLKYLKWQPAVVPALETREAEQLLPRVCEDSVGDQRTPALARVPLPPNGALVAAWDDYANRHGQGEPDVVVHYAPTHARSVASGDVFVESFTGADAAAWSSHWSAQVVAGTSLAVLERERGKVSSPSASGTMLLRVNHHTALNVDVTTDVQFNLNGSFGGIIARADDSANTYLGARFGTNVSDATLRVYAMVNGTKTDIAAIALPTAFSAHAQNLYFKLRFRVETVGSGDIYLATKYWSADLAEPAAWQIEHTVLANDAVAQQFAAQAGRFGLFANSGISSARSVSFDNFRATFFEGTQAGSLDGQLGQPVTSRTPLRRGKALYRTCTSDDTCDAGEGCCFDSTECAAGLRCTPAPNTTAPWRQWGSHAMLCAAEHCSNQTVDADEVFVDCGGVDCAPCACAPTAAPGSTAYCQPGCPCGGGGVDCNGQASCLPGTVCANETGYKYGFANGTDACNPSHCRNRIADGDEPDPTRPDWGGSCGSPECNTVNGSYAHCSVFCKCENGHGDCGWDDECVAGTTCFQNRGDRFGLGAGVDVCLKPHCYNNVLELALGETTTDCGGECGCGGGCPACP